MIHPQSETEHNAGALTNLAFGSAEGLSDVAQQIYSGLKAEMSALMGAAGQALSVANIAFEGGAANINIAQAMEKAGITRS